MSQSVNLPYFTDLGKMNNKKSPIRETLNLLMFVDIKKIFITYNIFLRDTSSTSVTEEEGACLRKKIPLLTHTPTFSTLGNISLRVGELQHWRVNEIESL